MEKKDYEFANKKNRIQKFCPYPNNWCNGDVMYRGKKKAPCMWFYNCKCNEPHIAGKS